MGATIERLAALIGCGFSWNADRHQDFSVEGALPNRVIAVVRQKNRLIVTHGCAMGSFENAIAPRAEEVAIAIEDDDRMFATGEAVDLVLSIDCNGCHFMKSPSVRQRPPVFDHFILVITAS